MYIFEFIYNFEFILPSTYPINKIFSVVVCLYKNHAFDERFLLLAIVAMVTEKMYFCHKDVSCSRSLKSGILVTDSK